VRPGFELGYKEDGKFYIFNHLQFNILVHPTHGEYMRARQGYRDAAVLDNIDARRMLLSRKELLAAGASEAVLGGSSSSGRQLAADDKAAAAGERGWLASVWLVALYEPGPVKHVALTAVAAMSKLGFIAQCGARCG
jgi:hypothetical protein